MADIRRSEPPVHADRAAAGEPDWVLHHVLEDNALRPSRAAGDTVRIDCSDRQLEDGALYAVRANGGLRVRLFLSGCFGIGPRIAGRAVGFLCSLAGPLAFEGPLAAAAIPVVGRVREHATVSALMAERGRVLEALGWARTALERLRAGGGPAAPAPETDTDALEALRAALEARLRDPSTRTRLAAELVVDALEARASRLEEVVTATPARDVAELEAKLRLLWDVEYAPFPELQDDFAAHLLAGALEDAARFAASATTAPPGREDGGEVRPVRRAGAPTAGGPD